MEQTESQIQSAFFEWLSLHEKKHPELSLFYAIPNGAHKSIAARMKFKREGLKAGVPDVHLPVRSTNYIGLWIEFKTEKGRISGTQQQWRDKLEDQGHRVVLCRSWTHAADVTTNYLNLPIKKFNGRAG